MVHLVAVIHANLCITNFAVYGVVNLVVSALVIFIVEFFVNFEAAFVCNEYGSVLRFVLLVPTLKVGIRVCFEKCVRLCSFVFYVPLGDVRKCSEAARTVQYSICVEFLATN